MGLFSCQYQELLRDLGKQPGPDLNLTLINAVAWHDFMTRCRNPPKGAKLCPVFFMNGDIFTFFYVFDLWHFFFYSFLEFPPFCYITHMVLDIVHFFPLEPFSILIIVKSIVWYSNTTPISDSASDASFVSSTFFFFCLLAILLKSSHLVLSIKNSGT